MARKNASDTIAYNNAYNAQHYDRVNLILPRGGKERLVEAAGELSLVGYIHKALIAQLERDGLDADWLKRD